MDNGQSTDFTDQSAFLSVNSFLGGGLLIFPVKVVGGFKDWIIFVLLCLTLNNETVYSDSLAILSRRLSQYEAGTHVVADYPHQAFYPVFHSSIVFLP